MDEETREKMRKLLLQFRVLHVVFALVFVAALIFSVYKSTNMIPAWMALMGWLAVVAAMTTRMFDILIKKK